MTLEGIHAIYITVPSPSEAYLSRRTMASNPTARSPFASPRPHFRCWLAGLFGMGAKVYANLCSASSAARALGRPMHRH